MIIKINKSEFHLLLTIRSICSRLLKITTAFSGFLVRGCNSKAVVNKESMQQVFPHLQPHHPLDFWTLEGTQKTQWFWIESPEFEKGFFTLINFFFVFSTILTQLSQIAVLMSTAISNLTMFGQEWTENRNFLSVCKILAGPLLKFQRKKSFLVNYILLSSTRNFRPLSNFFLLFSTTVAVVVMFLLS